MLRESTELELQVSTHMHGTTFLTIHSWVGLATISGCK